MINGINKDGFAYVLYINGGHQQWMILYPFKQKFIFMLMVFPINIIWMHYCLNQDFIFNNILFNTYKNMLK